MTSTTTTPRPGPAAASAVSSPYLLIAVVIASAIGGAFSGAQPTTVAPIDAFWCAAFAAGVAAAGSRARPWAWVWVAGVALLAAVGAPPAVIACAGAAVVAGLAGGLLRDPPPILGAIAAGLAAQALLRLSSFGFFGAPTLVGLVAVTPLLVSALRHSSTAVRRIVGCALAGALGFLAVVAFGGAALSARSQLDQGVAQARRGLDAVRKGDQAGSASALQESTASFTSAHDSLSAPWALAVRAVPIAAQQATALTQAADLGADLARTGSVTTSQANYRELRAAKGTIDLVKLRAMQQPIATSADALHDAQRRIEGIDSGWLVTPIASPLASLRDDIDREVDEVDLARDALAVAPDLLGGSGTKRYLVLFTNPAEARFLGGFVGAFAELTATDGKVTLGDTTVEGKFNDTLEAQQRQITISPELQQRYQRYDPARYLQNLTVSPDLPTDAALVREIYPQISGQPVDGIIVADPYALAGLLQLTGPVAVEGLAQPLSAQNAVEYLLKGQYTTGGPNSERKERLGESARSTFEALTSRDLPGPSSIGAALGPALAGGHLQFITFDDTSNALLERLGTIRRFDPQPGHDYFSLRHANANPNKIDPYLRRRVDYDVTYAPASGAVNHGHRDPHQHGAHHRAHPPTSSATPAWSRPSNTMYLSFYTPLQLSEATENRARSPSRRRPSSAATCTRRWSPCRPAGHAPSPSTCRARCRPASSTTSICSASR
jgi:hypothetical protein